MRVRAGKKWGQGGGCAGNLFQAMFSYVWKIPGFHCSLIVPEFVYLWKLPLKIVHVTNSLGWLGTNYWEYRECFFFSDTSQNLGMISNHSWHLKIWISIVGEVAGNQVQSLDLSFLPVSFSLSHKKNKMVSWTDLGIFLTYWQNLPVSQKTVTFLILQDFPDMQNQAWFLESFCGCHFAPPWNWNGIINCWTGPASCFNAGCEIFSPFCWLKNFSLAPSNKLKLKICLKKYKWITSKSEIGLKIIFFRKGAHCLVIPYKLCTTQV